MVYATQIDFDSIFPNIKPNTSYYTCHEFLEWYPKIYIWLLPNQYPKTPLYPFQFCHII